MFTKLSGKQQQSKRLEIRYVVHNRVQQLVSCAASCRSCCPVKHAAGLLQVVGWLTISIYHQHIRQEIVHIPSNTICNCGLLQPSCLTVMPARCSGHLTLPFGEFGCAAQVGQVAACLKAGSNLLHARLQTQALSPIQSTCKSTDAAFHALALRLHAIMKLLV